MQVSTLHVQGLLEGLRICGHDVARFAECAGISTALVDGAIGWMDVVEFERLCLSALDFTSDEAFGLHWGSTLFTQFDLGRTAMYAESLRAALERLDEFQRLLAERNELVLDASEGRARLTIHALATTQRGRRMRDEFAVTAMLRLFEHFGVLDQVSLDFVHAAPPHTAEYRSVLRRPVRFAQPRTCIWLPLSVLETPNHAPNRVMLGGLRELAETLLPAPEKPQLLVSRLRLLIAATWPKPLKISAAARILDTSERTLRRALERDGETYSQLVQGAQIERAKRLLVTSHLSIKQVAAQVGFESATAFQRAFKRRTGQTPLGYRTSRSS